MLDWRMRMPVPFIKYFNGYYIFTIADILSAKLFENFIINGIDGKYIRCCLRNRFSNDEDPAPISVVLDVFTPLIAAQRIEIPA